MFLFEKGNQLLSVTDFLKPVLDKHLGFEKVEFIGPVPDIAVIGLRHRVIQEPSRTAKLTDAFETQVFDFQRQ